LKHGEVVQAVPAGRSGFGLPVAVLQKLLHAPSLPKPGEEFETASYDETLKTSSVAIESSDRLNLSENDFDLPQPESSEVSKLSLSKSGIVKQTKKKVLVVDRLT